MNSPSDVAFTSRDSATPNELTFTASTLNTTFSALNSVQPGGIHPSPGQTTGGNGPLTGQEVEFDVIEFDVTFTTPFELPPDHSFFVPQVEVNNGGVLLAFGIKADHRSPRENTIPRGCNRPAGMDAGCHA